MEDENRGRGDEESGCNRRTAGEDDRTAYRAGGDDEPREEASPEAVGGRRQRGIRRLDDEAAEAQVLEDLARLERHVVARARELLDAAHQLVAEPLRRVALLEELDEVGLRLAEDVEVGIELLADALDRHQRLADQHEVGRDLDAVLHRALHEVADHRREIDLLERPAEVLLGEQRDLGAVLAHVDLLRRPADGVERVGDARTRPCARRRSSDRRCDRAARATGGRPCRDR